MKQQNRVQPASKKIEESLSYSVEVKNREGRVLQRVSAPSRSYVQAWNQVLNGLAAHAIRFIIDTGGILRSVTYTYFALDVAAPIGNATLGFRVGKGTTPVAITDYALETPCEEGTGVDEFNHQVVTFTTPTVVGPSCSFTVSRVMINNSGATITGIREIGAYVIMHQYRGLGFRDILPSPVSVPDGGAITVTYTIKVTV